MAHFQSTDPQTMVEWRAAALTDPERWARLIGRVPGRHSDEAWKRAIRVWRGAGARDGDGPPRWSGDQRGAGLVGVPFLVKDCYDEVREVTACSSRVLLESPARRPAQSDAALVHAMRQAGAHPVGRTNMTEFAYGLDGRNPFTGDCPHPRFPDRIAGGSSSGSAWAVARGVVPIALGTDTGGSIRLPASLCGIYGFRCSWRRERCRGVFPLAPSLDAVGWLCATATDMARTIAELPEWSGLDSDAPPSEGSHPGRRPRVAVWLPAEVSLRGTVERAFHAQVDAGAAAGWWQPVRPASLRALDGCVSAALDAYRVIRSDEAWRIHRPLIEEYAELYDPPMLEKIRSGAEIGDVERAQAHAARERVTATLRELLETVDAMIMPVTPVASPTFAEADAAFQQEVLRLNAPASVAGFAALSIPFDVGGPAGGTTAGLQLLVPDGREALLAAVVARIAGGEENGAN